MHRQVIRAAMKGAGIRTVGFIQTRLSFSLIGQPGMVPGKIKNVAVSGIGSLAHYAATLVMKKLNNEKVAYISTNTTANSYTSLLGKAADAVILTPPYTSMATLAGVRSSGVWGTFFLGARTRVGATALGRVSVIGGISVRAGVGCMGAK